MAWLLDDDTPIYIQISNKIKVKIINGEYEPGSKLTPIREFSADIAVNPNTVQKAFLLLEQEGLVISRRTIGKFITQDLDVIEKLKNDFIRDETKKFLTNVRQLGLTDDEIISQIKKSLGEEI